MKISKMMLHYTTLFTIPTAIALYYWKPKSDEEIRKEVESQIRPDMERRKKHQEKYRQLLLHRDDSNNTDGDNKK